MDHIQQLFEKYALPPEELQALLNYEWQDNFQLIPLPVFEELIQYRDEFGLPDTVFPLIDCGGSNYIGIHTTGPLKNKICFIDHEEMDVSPVFRNVQQLLSAIAAAEECYDYRDIPEDSFDFPSLPGLPEPLLADDRAIVTALREQYITDNENIQLAFYIMALTPYDDIAALIPWLDDKDMYIQERAIKTFGFHRYLPVKQRLEELTTKAQHNGKLAASIALKRFNSTAP